jgi:hypothetical protein
MVANPLGWAWGRLSQNITGGLPFYKDCGSNDPAWGAATSDQAEQQIYRLDSPKSPKGCLFVRIESHEGYASYQPKYYS